MPVSELPTYRVHDLMRVGSHNLTCELLACAVAAVDASPAGLILNMFDALERRELDKLRRDLSLRVRHRPASHVFSPAAENRIASCCGRTGAAWSGWTWHVSFGSLACMSARDLVETAWGIASSGVPFSGRSD